MGGPRLTPGDWNAPKAEALLCCLVVSSHSIKFVSQGMDAFIECGSIVIRTSSPNKVTVNHNHAEDCQVDTLGPIMSANLPLKLQSILSTSVVLINPATVVIVEL